MRIQLQNLGRNVHELIILVALRQGPRHGYEIARRVEERSGGALTLQLGTLYPILHGLEQRRLVQSTWSEGGGRPRRIYSLTHVGASHLRQEAGSLKHTFGRLVDLVSDARS